MSRKPPNSPLPPVLETLQVEDGIKNLAIALATQYSLGWKSHSEMVGEMKSSLTAKEWAECNWQSWMGDAETFYKTNKKPMQSILNAVLQSIDAGQEVSSLDIKLSNSDKIYLSHEKYREMRSLAIKLEHKLNGAIEKLALIDSMPYSMVNDSESLRHTLRQIQDITIKALSEEQKISYDDNEE